VLRYLSRYTHRIAISNRRLVSADQKEIRGAARSTAATRAQPGQAHRL
jgi:hypothetical protein